MSETMLLSIAVYVFVLLGLGLGLTVLEFRKMERREVERVRREPNQAWGPENGPKPDRLLDAA